MRVKKKFILTVMFVFLMSTAAYATPLMDLSQGKVALDINYKPSNDLEASDSSGTLKLDGKNSNYDFGITFGLGNNFGFQYINYKTDSKTYSGSMGTLSGSVQGESQVQQFNVLYSLDKNLAAFVGYTTGKADLKYTNLSGTFLGQSVPSNLTASGKNVSGFQVGLVGSAPLGDKLTGYGLLGVGSKITNFEIGMGYEAAKNCEVNVFYRHLKYKDLEFDNVAGLKYDLTTKGMGLGVTFKF